MMCRLCEVKVYILKCVDMLCYTNLMPWLFSYLKTLTLQLLVQDMHFVAILALQGQDLEKILARRTKSPQGTIIHNNNYSAS